jgi:hypothetical protein
MCKRESQQYDAPNAWHNKFYREVTSKVDESIFKPLYTEGNASNRDGRPNAPARILYAMSILKEGCGCSDEQLYENCRFNLLFRKALGLVTLDEQCPSLDTYYGFRRAICKYEEDHGVNLFEKCFKQVAGAQAAEYGISGKSIRMDSKLISSNIAWYSRYELIQKTYCKEVTEDEIKAIADQSMREQALEFYTEDSAKTIYHNDSETMHKRLLRLGIVIDFILMQSKKGEKPLLRRVFDEQYEKDEESTVTVRDKRKISAKSVQNPNDPEADYRGKGGQKVKGYTTNITETCDEENKPNLITDVAVKPASTADNSFVEDAVKGSAEVTGHKVETVHADGAYQSEANRELAKDETNGFSFIANGIQGKPSRFDLNRKDEQTLEVVDKKTGEVIIATPVKPGTWKIPITNDDGKATWRYFDEKQIAKSVARREVEAIPFEERKKRNNIEATIFQYCFHTRNNKTRYRGLLKHKIQAVARCLWINVRRLLLFDEQIALQMA